MVHLASTKSTGGEEKLSEADNMGKSIGHLALSGQQEAGYDLVTVTGELKNSGRDPGHPSNSHSHQARLRSKTAARSEDIKADDELVSVKSDLG